MAPFRWPEDQDRLDWRLLQNGPVTLYFSRAVLADHVRWLQEHRYAVHAFDCSTWPTEEAFHQDIARALQFPGYYGGKLNALHDCLGDLEVPPDGGVALAFAAFDAWWKKAPDRYGAVLDIIADNSRRFLLTGQRLLALVQSDDRDIRLPEVGASPVMVNPAEFGRVAPG
jgi:RNAse (barnase) inhibitor barstar